MGFSLTGSYPVRDAMLIQDLSSVTEASRFSLYISNRYSMHAYRRIDGQRRIEYE